MDVHRNDKLDRGGLAPSHTPYLIGGSATGVLITDRCLGRCGD
jgi:hypothetical protein